MHILWTKVFNMNTDFDIDITYDIQEQIVETISLRDWQRKAKKFFFDNDCKALFEVSTGSGKTIIAIDIIHELLKKNNKLKVLIVVPKNVILESTWYKELVDFGVPIQNIGVYYGDVKEYAQITLTNVQNFHKVPLELFNMICLDEAHNCGTRRLLELLQHDFKYRLGLTATLKRMDKKHYEILKIFNYNRFTYKPKEALEDGVLNPFIFYNITVTLDRQSRFLYDELTQQLNAIFQAGGGFERIMRSTTPLKFKMLTLINERKKLVNNYRDKFLVAQQIIKQFRTHKIIVFNQFNDQTSKLYWYLLDDEIECRIVHSGVTKDNRDRALIDFKNDKFNVLLTSKVLDEGYNLPKLDIAIIMAGDTTDKQTIQRMGRVLRKKDNQDSLLFQIYCRETIEENSANERAKIFKSLASDYRDIEFVEGMQLQF